MNKLFFMALVAAAITLSSCNGGTKPAQSSQDSTSVNDSVAQAPASATSQMNKETKTTVDNLTSQLTSSLKAKDNKAVISTLANLETIYKNLVEQGKVEEATKYASAIQQFLNEHKEELTTFTSGNTTIAQLVTSIANLPTAATTTAEEAKKAVSTDIVNLASKAIASGSTTVATAEEAADLINNAPATVKSAATAAATAAAADAENAAASKANEAVEQTHKKVNEKVNQASQKAADKVNKAASKALDKVFGN